MFVKTEILSRLETGESLCIVMAEFNVGKSSLYDIKSSITVWKSEAKTYGIYFLIFNMFQQ